ncbi:hypothetical protein [Candidatus Aalborgicola defluviihabitans]|uniref:hypothetical protein n=1 Tax=Candidatus Aalborgicola defluviihabitans TaxID=3386187 RepID=UPI0039B92ED3
MPIQWLNRWIKMETACCWSTGECAFGGEHVGGPLHLFGDEGRGDLGLILFGLDEPLRGGDHVLEQFGLRGCGF